jgi:hypothetical protein
MGCKPSFAIFCVFRLQGLIFGGYPRLIYDDFIIKKELERFWLPLINRACYSRHGFSFLKKQQYN